MRGNSCCAWLFLLWASSVSTQGAHKPAAVLHESRCGEYLLQWMGERPEAEFEPRFGTVGLRIVRPDGRSRQLQPSGKLFFSDWVYEPCSPNARWLVFLQDHYGPLHGVRYENLWRYLHGQKADRIITGVEGDVAQVHSEIVWVGGQTLQFEIGGSPPLRRVVRLP